MKEFKYDSYIHETDDGSIKNDWNCYGNKKTLKYYSRVSTGNHWALLEFIQQISEFYREDEIWISNK